MREQHLAKLLRAEVRIDAGREHDATEAAVAEKVRHLFREHGVEVDLASDVLAVHDAALVRVLGRVLEPLHLVREGGAVVEPALFNIR